MAWAKHAAGCGLTLEQIKTELLDGRDLARRAAANARSNTLSAPPAKPWRISESNHRRCGVQRQVLKMHQIAETIKLREP